MRGRLIERVDTVSHRVLDPYITAKPFGFHLPGWGFLQVWQHRLCDAYDRSLFGSH